MDAKERQEHVSLEGLEPGRDPHYKAALQRLKSLLQDEAELSRLSLALGKSSRYLSNLFSEGAPLLLPCLLKLAQLTGIPAAVFFENIGPKRAWLPEQVLYRERERGTKVKQESAFLTELAPRLEKLKKAKVEPGVPGRRPTLLDPLEDERFRNRLAAMQGTEALAEELTAECESRAAKGTLQGPRLGELSAAIALWATIQRTLGLRNLAIQAFQLSFPLARQSHDAWANGTNHQRAAHVFHDLGRPDLSLDFLAEAIWHYDAIDDSTNRWRCFVDRGVFLGRQARLAESTLAFDIALSRIGHGDWRHRVGAMQGLAINAQREGRLKEALAHTEAAVVECREVDSLTGFLKWRLASILFDLKRTAEANQTYRECTSLMVKYGSGGDLALVALDHAEALFKNNQVPEALTLAADVTKWLPGFRANPVLHRAMSAFVDLIRLGQSSLDSIRATRTKVLSLQPTAQELPRAQVFESGQPPT